MKTAAKISTDFCRETPFPAMGEGQGWGCFHRRGRKHEGGASRDPSFTRTDASPSQPFPHRGGRALVRRLLAAGLGLAVIASEAGSACASTLHSYSYDPDSDFARHRTQDIILTVRRGLMGGERVLHLYRRRGDGFDVRPSFPWSEQALGQALGPDARGASLYQIDPKDGAGFARGACSAEKAWLAFFAPKPYQPLRIVVLRNDPATRAPVVCETLDYVWHGEWLVPPPRRGVRVERDEAPKARQ